ncbi:hypothetical protein [Actinacidiphila bryophytorum]|uniref:Eukaryotic translation initiation factor 4B n=1 Tax=Actinacidiphila bryophytorum TaxID=1436133 RepID=A0A9W4E4H4_9ACTN|nr:hypothetical protein [Actinacidiphila bryophytorum]MBM9439294.1 hypothetical protein [Actinacidiphila bryophytorum]MBN6545397.1 hypothetical protein [Actinacidiphila bryophytorum]CAG7619312.1 Eukaryotic translation initiation factor 4B [Actinacidiphila bryophytorum]
MTTEPSPAAEEPSLPDDVWEQFANDSERAIRASAPKEPSARARIVARRLREEDERAAEAEPRRWVRRRPQPPHTPSQAAAAWRPDNRPPKPPMTDSTRRLRALAGIVLVVAVVLVLLAPGRAWSWITG